MEDSRMNVIGLISVYDLMDLICDWDIEYIVDCGRTDKGDSIKIYTAIKPVDYTLISGEVVHVSFGIDYGYEERITDLLYPCRVIPYFSVKHKWDEEKNKATVSCLKLYIKNLRRFTIRITDKNKGGIQFSTILKPCRDFPIHVWSKFIYVFRNSVTDKLKQIDRLLPMSEYEEIARKRFDTRRDKVILDADAISYVKKLGSNIPPCAGWLD